MKKIFTLISMALFAMSTNAAELPENVYPYKTITWGDITWKNGNNKKDKENKDMLFLMGTGNGYEQVYCEYFLSESSGEYVSRPYYTYIDYENGGTGIPGYGLYYKFTPAVAGALKVNVWVNKGNRKTFVVKVSDGKPLTPYVDYTFDGYVNGQNTNTDKPALDENGQQVLDDDGNPVWIQAPIFFTAEEIKARHDEAKVKDGVDTAPYVIDAGNQAVWGWLSFNVEAGESYVVYQQSSQIGFGGYDFTPAGGAVESYVSCVDDGTNKVIAPEFKAVVNEDGVAQNVTNEGSVVEFGTANMKIKAVGASTPTEITPDLNASVEIVKAAQMDANAPIYNLAGQQVAAGFKGIAIQNGKKVMMK